MPLISALPRTMATAFWWRIMAWQRLRFFGWVDLLCVFILWLCATPRECHYETFNYCWFFLFFGRTPWYISREPYTASGLIACSQHDISFKGKPEIWELSILSRLQTSKFSMTSFYVTSFICSSVHATLTICSMTSALVRSMLAFEQVHLS
jgi:hypothetical protein